MEYTTPGYSLMLENALEQARLQARPTLESVAAEIAQIEEILMATLSQDEWRIIELGGIVPVDPHIQDLITQRKDLELQFVELLSNVYEDTSDKVALML